jgi:hypothetical protein
MAYIGQHNWWLEGPVSPRGFGGLGQATLASAFGFTSGCPNGFAMDSTGVCSQDVCDVGYTLTSPGVCTAPTSVVPGIPNSYLYIGGAIFAGLLLMGALKR